MLRSLFATVLCFSVVCEGAIGPRYLGYDCPDGCCYSNKECRPPGDTERTTGVQACLDGAPPDCPIRVRMQFLLAGSDLQWGINTQRAAGGYPGLVAFMIDSKPVFDAFPDLMVEPFATLYNITTTCDMVRICHSYKDKSIGCTADYNLISKTGGGFRSFDWRKGLNGYLMMGTMLSKYLTQTAYRSQSRTMYVYSGPNAATIPGNKVLIENCWHYAPTDLAGMFMTFSGRIAVYGGTILPEENQYLGIFDKTDDDGGEIIIQKTATNRTIPTHEREHEMRQIHARYMTIDKVHELLQAAKKDAAPPRQLSEGEEAEARLIRRLTAL